MRFDYIFIVKEWSDDYLFVVNPNLVPISRKTGLSQMTNDLALNRVKKDKGRQRVAAQLLLHLGR